MRLWSTLLVLLAAAAPARADVWADLSADERAVSQLEAARTQAEARQQTLARDSQALAADIDRLKAEPAGVRRDARLQEQLAAQQAKSAELEQLATQLRGRRSLETGARRKLLTDCDRALASNLPEAKRLELDRLRAAQATALAQPVQPLGIVHATTDPLDGPRELQDKADLLRDSEDKLRREAQRLALRIDDVERRRHLRERAGAIDEDLFGEGESNRHSARVLNTPSTTTGGISGVSTPVGGTGGSPPGGGPAGPTGGVGSSGNGASGSGSNGSPSNGATGNSGLGSDSTTVLRNLVDPATLDELRRADGGDDLERQLRALRRAQGELEGLAGDLDRRARALSNRAHELKYRK